MGEGQEEALLGLLYGPEERKESECGVRFHLCISANTPELHSLSFL